MVNIRDRVFLVSGSQALQRQYAINNIRKRILKTRSSALNSIIFYPKDIKSSKDLGEKLFASSFDRSQVVIFKDFQNLSSSVRDFIFKNLKKILAVNYIIFETDRSHYQLQKNRLMSSDQLFSLILKRAASFKVASEKKEVSIEGFINSLRERNLASSLYVLDGMFARGTKNKILGPQILGILIKRFSYLKNPAEKERCFKYLWEADRALKENGLDTRLTIETLLVKLFERS